MWLLNIILLLIYLYLLGATLYFLIFSVASNFSIPRKRAAPKRRRRFAVLIPGYKEDAVIIDVARDALEQSYPRELFEVIIIADSFKAETLKELSHLPLKLIEVSFEKSTKSKALNRAMAELSDDYDIAMVLDADNLMESDCLEKFNRAFDSGCMAIQGHRVAKNLNTGFAILDALSEEINNNIFRKGQRVLGLSSGLIGSGMAFDYTYFKTAMSQIDAIGGFDKELELRILEDRQLIEYLDDARIYDEKVQKAEVFYNQRKRWLSSQGRNFYSYLGKAFSLLLFKGNLNYFNKVYQWMHPPRILYLGSLALITMAVLIFHPQQWMVLLWLSMFLAGFLAFLLAIPGSFYNRTTLKAMLKVPVAFFLMFKALLQIKGSNKEFIHTEHTDIDSSQVKKLHRSKAS